MRPSGDDSRGCRGRGANAGSGGAGGVWGGGPYGLNSASGSSAATVVAARSACVLGSRAPHGRRRFRAIKIGAAPRAQVAAVQEHAGDHQHRGKEQIALDETGVAENDDPGQDDQPDPNPASRPLEPARSTEQRRHYETEPHPGNIDVQIASHSGGNARDGSLIPQAFQPGTGRRWRLLGLLSRFHEIRMPVLVTAAYRVIP